MGEALVKRSNPIYVEIENFKDYELTNNIAYEMLIRNEFAMDLWRSIDKLNAKLLNTLFDIEDIIGFSVFDEPEFKSFKIMNFMDVINCGDTDSVTSILKLVSENTKLKTLVDRFDKTKKKVDSLESLAVKLCIPLHDGRGGEEQFEVANMNDNGKFRKSNFYDFAFADASVCNYDLGWNYFPKFGDEHEDSISKRLPIAAFRSESFCDIVPGPWGRPKLISPFMKRAMVEINFSYPENELVAFIREIKKFIDKDTRRVNFSEDGYSQELALEMHDIYEKKAYKIVHTANNKKVRFAHMFYVYDSYKAGVGERIIMAQLNDYEYDELQKPTKKSNGGIDKDTVSKQYTVTKDYIDGFRYVELVSGHKLPQKVFEEIEATKPILAKILSK